MILRWAVLGLVLLTALLLDAALLGGLRVAGTAPSAVLLSVVAAGLASGPERAAGYGFAAGLAADLLSGGLMGSGALVHLLVGWCAGVVRHRLPGPPLLAEVLVGAAATAAAVVLSALLAGLLQPTTPALGRLLPASLGAGALAGVLAPLVLRPVGAVLRRVDGRSAG